MLLGEWGDMGRRRGSRALFISIHDSFEFCIGPANEVEHFNVSME